MCKNVRPILTRGTVALKSTNVLPIRNWRTLLACYICTRQTQRRSICTHQIAALFCVKLLHGRSLEIVASNLKSDCNQSMRILLKNNPVKFHPDLVWNDRALGFFTARCTLVQSAVLRSHVVRPSVCLSECNVQVPWSHRLEFLENNFTAE